MAAAADARGRHRPMLPPWGVRSGRPVIYFVTPDYNTPAGGIRVIYRHVDILNEAGLDAAVLHQREGFRCNWFENSTRVEYVTSTTLDPRDLVVVSELDVDRLIGSEPMPRHIVFNQNAFLTWSRDPDGVSAHYRGCPDLIGILTVSSQNVELLRYAFPGRPIGRIHVSVDPHVFFAGSSGCRPKRITYMPRRGAADAVRVLSMLRTRGLLSGWELKALDGLSQNAIAEELRMSRVFLAFTEREGFGLPAAEAMACGNYVIGNHGFGGAEFFRPEFSTAVEVGDALAFAEAVEQTLEEEDRHEGYCAARGALASAFINREYGPSREYEDVVQYYSGALA